MNITKWGLGVILATNLSGMLIFEELLSKLNLETDGDGNLFPHQIDNIKMFLEAAFRISVASRDVRSFKIKKALESLLDYGTKESSDYIRWFLGSPESEMPVVITDPPMSGDDYAKIKHVVSSFMSPGHAQVDPGTLGMADALIRDIAQDFSEPPHTIQ